MLDTVCIPISLEGESPAVAFDGTNYLVAWQASVGGSYNIYGDRVAQDGAVLDTLGITISAGVADEVYPSVASDGDCYLVVWQDERNGDPDIYGAPVSTDGTVLDPAGIPIRIAVANQEDPCVCYDGTNYLVVWSNYWDNNTWYDIHGARVSPDGTVLDPEGFVISGSGRHQWHQSITFGGTNYLVVWSD